MSSDCRKGPETKRLTISLAVSAAIAGSSAATAQDNQDSEAPVLEEILVTATKRELNLQDTPLSVTAFSNEKITLQRFKNFADYASQVPSLAVSDRQPGANSVIMRGCAAQGLSFSDSATTSIYLDEQPITSSGYNPDPRLVDVARVEALGGPQGTLFGDAAQCGTLRIITNKPDVSNTSGWVDLTGSTVQDGEEGYDISGMVNIPLMQDKLALRVVGFYADEPGWVDNVLSPSPGGTFDNSARVEEDVNSSIWYGGRVGLRLVPAEDWTVDLVYIYQKYELDGFGDVSLNQQQYEDTDVFPDFDDREQARFTEDDWEDEWYQIALTIEANLDIGNFVLTGAYFDRESAYFADATAYVQNFQLLGDYFRSFNTGDPYYDTGGIYDFGGDPLANDFDARETTAWSLEARYATPTEGRWGAIVGAFYSERDVDELFISNVLNNYSDSEAFAYINYAGYYFNGIPPKEESNNWFSGTYESELEQWAVFGEVNVDLTERFTITAGGRYYDIKNDYIVKNGAHVGLNGGELDCAVDYCYAPGDLGESDEDGFVPKVNLAYKTENHLFYATYSEGFRRGGANSARPQSVFGPPSPLFDPPAGTLNSYEADTVINYEIGAKTEWLNKRLRINITAYHMVWEDIQVQANDPQPDVFTLGIVNFPEAEIDGFETWISWLPNENWNIELTAGYNDGELSKSDVLFPGTDGELVVPSGTELPIIPDWKANLNVTYSFSSLWREYNPYILARYNYTGKSVNSLAGIESSSFSAPVVEQDSWERFDLQFGLSKDQWTAALFVDNVSDENAQLFFNNRFAQQRLSVNKPRTIGINFRYNFGG
ncbi:MAG: TonB-dependent receptor [Gammaproteobacteria bacterium]|nr:TonB-dependent receptor [Gammaproteobacteria bacterium]